MSAINFSLKILGMLIFSTSAMAATLEVPVQEGDRLIVKGLSAQVQLIAQPNAKTLRVSGVEEGSHIGAYALVKKDHLIEVRMNDFDSKKDWKEALAKPTTWNRKIEIVGAAIPVEVHLRDGSVVLQKWTREAVVSVVSGRVNSTGGSGSLQVNLQKGELNVADHNGKVSTDGYSGTSNIKNVQGDVDAQLFTGNLLIDKMKGSLNLNSQQANSKVTQSSGSVQFEVGKGPLSIQGYQGRIEGQTNEGSVSINFLPESELNLKSKSGRISIQAPAGSGAALNLLTVDGDIFVPKELRVNRLSSEKSVRGRLRGEGQKASIIVRSQEGSITVK